MPASTSPLPKPICCSDSWCKVTTSNCAKTSSRWARSQSGGRPVACMLVMKPRARARYISAACAGS